MRKFGFVFVRDVQNIFFLFRFAFGSVFEKTRTQFGISLVWFTLKKYGSDIIVIYDLCNSRVVNLQQVLQRHCCVE